MTRKSKIRLQKERAEEAKRTTSFLLLAVIGGAAVGGVLYILHVPSFLVLLAAAGTALIAGAKIWGRR
jgi:hypothetical protein